MLMFQLHLTGMSVVNCFTIPLVFPPLIKYLDSNSDFLSKGDEPTENHLHPQNFILLICSPVHCFFIWTGDR